MASNVQFDLAGLAIGGDGATGDGIRVGPTPTRNVRIRNGTVTAFVVGIRLVRTTRSEIADVVATQDLSDNIQLRGVTRSRLAGNTATGSVLSNGIVLDSDFNGTDTAFSTANDVIANRSSGNNGSGLVVGEASGNRIFLNAFTENSNDGVNHNSEFADDNVLMWNLVTNNASQGIRLTNLADGQRIRFNISLNNTEGDMQDNSAPAVCQNTWEHNVFVTDNEGDGPDAGCIQ